LDEIRKGSLVIFKNVFGETMSPDDELMKAFTEIFGPYGVVVSDIYKDDVEGLVVDLWFSSNIMFYAIPVSRLQVLQPT